MTNDSTQPPSRVEYLSVLGQPCLSYSHSGPHQTDLCAGSHFACLNCCKCGRWLKWISKSRTKKIASWCDFRTQPGAPTTMALAFREALRRQEGRQ
jgi:hypothetical protein